MADPLVEDSAVLDRTVFVVGDNTQNCANLEAFVVDGSKPVEESFDLLEVVEEDTSVAASNSHQRGTAGT